MGKESEGYDRIDPVQELRPEVVVESLCDEGLDASIIIGILRAGVEAQGALVESGPGPKVRGHDQDCIFEIDGPPEAIGQASLFEDLQQHIGHIRVRLLDFVEQHDGIGLPADLFCKLAAFLVADVARR